MFFTLRDTTNLGFMKAVDLVLVFTLLLENSIKKVQLSAEVPQSSGTPSNPELAGRPIES